MRIIRFLSVIIVGLVSMGTLFGQVFNMKEVPVDTIGHNNGTIWRTSGKIVGGQFINDGGESTLFCGRNPSLNVGTGDLTIVATVTLKEKQLPRIGFVSKGVVSNGLPGYSLQYDLTDKRLYLCIGDDKERIFYPSKSIILNDNKPYRIAVSLNREAGIVIFAVDGKVCTRGGNTLKGKSLDTSDQLSIGSWSYGYYINGAITNIQIYKKSFSQAELKTLTTK